MRARIILGWLLLQVASTGVWADVRLPTVISDHVVLQRGRKIHLWGWGDPGEAVRVRFHGQTYETRVDSDHHWQLDAGPFQAGGPFEMRVQGHNLLEVHDILIGDVWVASGQSNMEFPVAAAGDWRTGVENADSVIRDADLPGIRLFREPHRPAFRPATDITDASWTPVTPESVKAFSAVAYLFGRELHAQRRVPIGLIQAAWGGTLAEAWTSASGLKPFPDLGSKARALAKLDQEREEAADLAYQARKSQWWERHGAEQGDADWANPDFDAVRWPVTSLPSLIPAEGLHSFDGTVWFRREFDLPEGATQPVRIAIPMAYRSDTTYLNGVKIGENATGDAPRSYMAPAGVAHAGRNVLALKMSGDSGYVGIYGDAAELYAQSGSQKVSLAGPWFYHPGSDLAEFPQAPRLSRLRVDPTDPSILFNGMVAPLTSFTIRGVIWYQGEANATAQGAPLYRTLFPALIRDWRDHWGYPVPFLFVQLAGFGQNSSPAADYPWAELREAQFKTLKLPSTGMATAVDIGDEKNIHPRNKQDVAHRLALVAAHVVYGEDNVYSGPIYESMHVEAGRVRIRFSTLGGGLVIRGKSGKAQGFVIAGADGQFKWANAEQDGNDLIVSSPDVLHPKSVRYAWENTPNGNVYNREGLPALPFRTDTQGR